MSINEEPIYYVYVYLNPLKPGKYTYSNLISFYYEPFYIGKGKGNRIRHHLYNRKHYNPFMNGTLQKIKKNSQEVFVIKIESDISSDIAKELEILYIKTIGRRSSKLGPLCNLTDGGDGTRLIGKDNPMFGKHHSEETKQKISKIHKGKIMSEESKQKMKDAAKHKPKVSEETKQKLRKPKTTEHKLKMSAYMSSNKNPMNNEEYVQKLRKPKTEEHRLNIKISQQKRREREALIKLNSSHF